MPLTRTQGEAALKHVVGNVLYQLLDGDLMNALVGAGANSVTEMAGLRESDIEGLTVTADDGTTSALKRSKCAMVVCFCAFVRYRATQSSPIGDDWLGITPTEYNAFRVNPYWDGTIYGNATRIYGNTDLPTAPSTCASAHDRVDDSERGIKRDASRFLILKDEKQSDNWQTTTVAQASGQEFANVLDPIYTPTTTEDKALQGSAQDFAKVLNPIYVPTTAEDKALQANAQEFAKVLDPIYTPTTAEDKALVQANAQDVAEELDPTDTPTTAEDKALFQKRQKKKMLQNAVQPVTELRAVRTQADQAKTHSGNGLTYSQYVKLPLPAASAYDTQFVSKTRLDARPPRHDMYFHDITESNDNDGDFVYDIECALDVIPANDHSSDTARPPGTTLDPLGGETSTPIIKSRHDSNESGIDSNDGETKEYHHEPAFDKTFLMDPQEDGQCFRTRIVRAIEDHDGEPADTPTRIEFLCSINDDESEEIVAYNVRAIDYYDGETADTPTRIEFLCSNNDGDESEEIIAYNEILNHIESDESEETTVWNVKRIIAHEGPLIRTHSSWKGSSYDIMLERENGEITSEPLAVIAADDPAVTCAIYAKGYDLLETDGWKRFKPIARRKGKLLHMVNQTKLRSYRTAPNYQCGYEVPKDYQHAVRLDERAGNTKWQDSTKLDMNQLDDYDTFKDYGHSGRPPDYDTFKDYGDSGRPPDEYKKIRVHLIFTVKHDGRHKSRLIADGHLTDVSLDSLYSGVVSLRGPRLLLVLLAELNATLTLTILKMSGLRISQDPGILQQYQSLIGLQPTSFCCPVNSCSRSC
jgi:hypothetical protein